jgi:glycine/D-amino acid oxidase-like deaminating enzyme
MDRANVLIAGGGIIGTAVAWALAQRGVTDIVVVDLDLAGVYASSELNAGGARASWWQPVNIASCAATLEFFRGHREAFAFRECGYLWLYDDEALFAQARQKSEFQNSFGLEIELLAPGAISERFPLLDRKLEEIVGATHSPHDGLLNPNAVRHWYREEAKRLGVRFLDRHYIAGVTTQRISGSGGGRRRVASLDLAEVELGDPLDDAGTIRDILTTHRVPARSLTGETRVSCEVVVNCLGAWSPLFSAKIGVSDVRPRRRRRTRATGHDRRCERPVLPPGGAPCARGLLDPRRSAGLRLHL